MSQRSSHQVVTEYGRWLAVLGALSVVCANACASGFQLEPPGDGGAAGGGGGSVDSGHADGGLDQRSACAVLNNARCTYLAGCGLIGSSDTAFRACQAWLTATWCGPSTWPSRVDPLIATERYDGVQAIGCADAYSFSTRSCALYATEPLACQKVAVPATPLGKGCFDGLNDCAEGVCRGAACPRTCLPRGLAGEVCRLDGDCRSGLYCRLSNVTSGVGACTAQGAMSAPCDSTAPCQTGLSCAGGVCIVPPPAGSPCAGSLCDERSWCEAALDGGRCVSRLDGGTSCTDDVQCQAGWVCVEQVCQPKVVSPLASCSLKQTCADGGQVCVGATANSPGQCEAPKTTGQRCISSIDCEAHLACQSVGDGGRACGTRQADGTLCSSDRDCQLLSRCVRGVCTQLPTTGRSCDVTRSCLLGPCTALSDAGSVCTEPYGPGEVCAKDDDCASGRCAFGRCLPACAP